MSTAALIVEIEQTAEHADRLLDRLREELANMQAEARAIEQVASWQIMSRTAMTAAIVEAAAARVEAVSGSTVTDLLLGRSPLQ